MKPTHLLAAALITALILACLAAPAAAFSGAGSGTEADPYIITTPAQLQEMANDLDAYYKLGNDIDLSLINSWSPIGTTTSNPFTGSLNGNGFKISSLSSALFRVCAGNVHIYNLGLEVSGTGILCGRYSADSVSTSNKYAIFERIYITGTQTPANYEVDNTRYVTGLLGGITLYNQKSSTIIVRDCWSDLTIQSINVGTKNIDVGGIAGFYSASSGTGNAVLVENVYTLGQISNIISSHSSARVGGIIGNLYSSGNQASVSNSVALQSSITTSLPSSSSTSRVVETTSQYTSDNNYANAEMQINGASISSSAADSANGANVDASTYQTQAFWEDTLGWDFDNVWYWDKSANLPKLQVFLKSVPPTISAISATPSTGGQTTEYTLSITATTEAAGGIVSYQWSYSTDSGNTWQPISGATTASYVWQPGQSISGDVLLKCLVTGADGGEIDSYEAGYTNIKITVITPPAISSISVSRPLQKVNTPTTLTAIFADTQTATYQWYYSTNGGTTWQAITGATQTTAQYTPTTTGTHSIKIIVTNQYGESSELSTTLTVLPTYTPTPIIQTTFDASIDSSAKYQGVQQFTLSAELKALNYYTPNLAHLAHDNALYYLDSAEQEVIPVSNTTGGTISAAYIGQYTGIITDTEGNTAYYSYQTNDWQYIEQNSASIIASTSSYAATVSGGTLRIYNLNGNLISSTTTTAANLAGNDQTNVFVSYSGATITYYWYQDNEIKTASKTLPHTITELHQISTTSNWLISTTANTYTVSISDIGSYELLSTTDTDTPLIHTQATNINVLIGVAEPNEIFIVGADGETDGTYVTGSTLNDASIAKATGLFAITGGEDRQVYILAKSTSSTWQLLQTISFGAAIDHSQISTTGTYAAVSTGLKLYLLEAVDISANTYLLQGVIIGSSGSVWANKPFTINGDNLRTDANGRFVYSVQPSTLYTIVTDTTTTEYTATNAALQQIAIKLKPNPFAQSVSYSTDYNADTRNFEMIYTDSRDLTSSVTWVIRETGNQTIVSTQTVQAGQTAYWEVPLDKSFTSYQISMIADRQGTNVENVWIITPDGKSPINIPGLDETGRTIIFGAVLMIFGGLFGVMHSTKGALLTVALAGVMTYLGLLNIPWVIIMVAGTIAVAAILGKGSGGS